MSQYAAQFVCSLIAVYFQLVKAQNETEHVIQDITTQNSTSSENDDNSTDNTGAVAIAVCATVIALVAIVAVVFVIKRRRQSLLLDKEKKMQMQMSSARNAGVYQDLTVSVAPDEKPPASPEHEKLNTTEEA